MQELKDLLKRILMLNPSQRYGMLKRGALDVKEHPWFTGFDWKAFASGAMKAPYIPKVDSLYPSFIPATPHSFCLRMCFPEHCSASILQNQIHFGNELI